MDVESYLVYICTFLSTLLLSLFFVKQKKRKVKIGKKAFYTNDIYLVLMIIVLSVICGGRGFEVGIDTQSYVQWQFEYIKNFGFNAGTMPFVMRLIVYQVEHVFADYHVIYLIVSFITNTLIILRFRDFKEKSTFLLLTYAYICYVYCAEFNTWRQLLAVSVVFYGSRYAFERKYIKFLVFDVIAILIHSSAIMGLMIIPLDLFLYNKDDKYRKKITKMFIIMAPVILGLGAMIIYKYFDWQRYVYHFDHYGTTNSIGFMVPVRLLMLLILGRFCIDKVKTDNYIFQKKLYIFSTLAILLMSLDYFIVYAGRLSFYFILFESVLYGLGSQYWKNIKIVKCLRFTYCILGLYSFAIQLITNGNKIIPYSFWN